MKDHNSLRVKRKRRRPAKTEFPSPAHRGDSHEEGTVVKGSVFLQGQAAAVWDVLGAVGPSCRSPEWPLEQVVSYHKLRS